VTAREAIAEAERRLAAAGIDTPRVDADILVSHVLGVSRTQLYADLDREVDGLEPLIARFLALPEVDYLHAHFARRGCFAARIDRA